MIKDNFGRPVLNLRISITQRCNLHCPYCHREGQEWKTGSSVVEMTASEIIHIVRLAVELEIDNIKITGGEPLMRPDILSIVEGIADTKGLQDLSMTTNGTFLATMAKELKARGLKRINISLPSLKKSVYKRLMGGTLTEVLKGVPASVNSGLHPVKINMLVLSEVNDTEIPDMIQFARNNKAILQLIELEPINISHSYYKRFHHPMGEIEENLASCASRIEVRPNMQNRRIYYLEGVKVEVIRPTENSEFCAHCTRLRVTSDGKLKPCLMVNENLVDILTPMRNGVSDEELRKIFVETCRKREPYYKVSAVQTTH
jgi:cyclic pyranopterin phosphate synthase